MLGDNIDNLLPNDDELVRRENVFLGLFNRYSIDEGEDAELADLESPDKMDEDDNEVGSSFSDASSIEGDNNDDDDDDDKDDSVAMDKITKELAPVIQDRVNSWPKKGINLQLKTVDPSISVEEWLKANQESTTTTKTYKKTVVTEENKTITTIMKNSKTTTKKSTFRQSAFVPHRLMAMKAAEDQLQKEIVPEITEIPNNDTAHIQPNRSRERTKSKQADSKKKSKDQQTRSEDAINVEKLPVTIQLSKLADLPLMDKLPSCQVAEPKQPTVKLSELVYESITDDQPQPKLTKRRGRALKIKRQEKESPADKSKSKPMESKTKIAQPSEMPSAHKGNGRCLRSRMKENIVPQVENVRPVGRPPKTTKTKDKEKGNVLTHHLQSTDRSRSRLKEREVNQKEPQKEPKTTKTKGEEKNNRIDLPTNLLKSTDRSRSRLKEREVHQKEPQCKIREVRVNLKKLPCPKVTTRNSARIQKQLLEQTAGDETNANVHQQVLDDSTTASSNFEAPTSMVHRLPRIPVKQKRLPLRRQEIVLHSPNSHTLLGTKINDTTMLVTNSDYRKRINPKFARKTTIFDRSVIPINRRVVYHPPINYVNNDNMDNDSECEDVLLTSYLNTGRIVQVNV